MKPFFEIEFCRIISHCDSAAPLRTITLSCRRSPDWHPAYWANRGRLSHILSFPSDSSLDALLLRIVGVIVLAPLSTIGGFPRLFGAFRAMILSRTVDKFLTRERTLKKLQQWSHRTVDVSPSEEVHRLWNKFGGCSNSS